MLAMHPIFKCIGYPLTGGYLLEDASVDSENLRVCRL